MAFTHNITTQWSAGKGENLSSSVAITADAEDNRDIDMASGTVGSPTVVNVDTDFVTTNLKSIVVNSNRNVTISPVLAGTAGTPINIVANQTYIWYTGIGTAVPFSSNADTLRITNTSGAAALVKIRLLQDSTP